MPGCVATAVRSASVTWLDIDSMMAATSNVLAGDCNGGECSAVSKGSWVSLFSVECNHSGVRGGGGLRRIWVHWKPVVWSDGS